MGRHCHRWKRTAAVGREPPSKPGTKRVICTTRSRLVDAGSPMLAPQRRGARVDNERLLVIDIINAEGRVLLQTVWAVTADRLAGRRRTDIEVIGP
jgi:hypothetical protein